MESVKTLDYTPHYLAADRKLQEAYELLKRDRWIEATTKVDEIVVELRMMRAAIKSRTE